MRHACLCLLCLLAHSCGMPVTNGAYEGEPLVTLRGELLADPARPLTGAVRLAVGWFADETSASLGTLRAVSDWSGTFEAPFPVRFERSLFAPPPGDALAGVLIAYADGNSNGSLDPSAVGEPSPDTVLGSSVDDASPDGYRLVYSGEAPSAERLGLSQGFNLVGTRTGVVAFSTSIPIRLTANPLLQNLLCRSTAPGSGEGNRACTQDTPPGVLKVIGSLGIAEGLSSVELSVEDLRGGVSDAALSVNQRSIPFDPGKGRYSALDGAAPFLRAGEANHVSVRAAGYGDLDLQVPLAGTFQVTAPAFNAAVPSGAGFTISWTEASRASGYLVRIFDASFKTVFERRTVALSLSTGTVSYTGSATLVIQADAERVRTDGGSLVVPYVNAGVPLRLQ